MAERLDHIKYLDIVCSLPDGLARDIENDVDMFNDLIKRVEGSSSIHDAMYYYNRGSNLVEAYASFIDQLSKRLGLKFETLNKVIHEMKLQNCISIIEANGSLRGIKWVPKAKSKVDIDDEIARLQETILKLTIQNQSLSHLAKENTMLLEEVDKLKKENETLYFIVDEITKRK